MARPSAWGRTPQRHSAASQQGSGTASSSAFPDLSAAQSVPQTRRARAARAVWDDSARSSFNPYPSRVDELNARAEQWRRSGRASHFSIAPELVLDGEEGRQHDAPQGCARIVVHDKTAPNGTSSGGAWASMFHVKRTGSAASRAVVRGIQTAAQSGVPPLLRCTHDKEHEPPPPSAADADVPSGSVAGTSLARIRDTMLSTDTPESERDDAAMMLTASLLDMAASKPGPSDILAALEVSSHVSRACTEALAACIDASIAPHIRTYDLDRLAALVDSLTGALSWQVSAHWTRSAATIPKALIDALAHVRDAHAQRSTQLPASRFYVAATELPPIVNAYTAWLEGATNLCAWPWTVTLGGKAQILAWEAQTAMRHASSEAWAAAPGIHANATDAGTWSFSVARATIVADSMDAMRAASLDMLHRPLRVLFRDEPAQDAGGLRKEWLQVLCDALQSTAPWTDLGATEPKMRGLLYVQDVSSTADVDRVEMLGMALGLALFHQITVPLRLAPALYRMLLAMANGDAPPCDLDTLAQLKPDLAAGLARLLQEDAERVDEMHLTWQVDTAQGPQDLCVNGGARRVTAVDREAYVARLCTYMLLESVQAPLHALVRGFASVVAPASGRSPLALLAPHELETLLCGRAERTLDLDAVRTHTELVSFPARDAPGAERVYANLESFWLVWSRLAADEQHALLGFITGCTRVPALGARALGLRIHHVEPDSDVAAARVPWSSTCTSTLFLPVYATEAELHAKVRIAIRHSTGFGLA